jgi:hypothetical protein
MTELRFKALSKPFSIASPISKLIGLKYGFTVKSVSITNCSIPEKRTERKEEKRRKRPLEH